MNYLAQVMARAKPSDELTLALDEKASKLGLTFKGASRRSFSIPLIDISSSELPNPKIDFDATIKMKAEILQDGLKDAVLISSHILLGVSDKSFFLKANSSKGELDSETGSKEKGILDFSAKKECKSMFPLDYLSDMLKVAASDTPIEVNLKNNAPARISYAIGKASITYFLAPRIESE
jgi:proliferating cell nuclear antigen